MQIIKKCNFAATQVLTPIYNARPQKRAGVISFIFFTFVACGTARAVAAAALAFYFFIDKPTYYGESGNGDNYRYDDIERVHFLLLFLKILRISNLPVFLKAISATAAPTTASHMNSVHHQLPTVYIAAAER